MFHYLAWNAILFLLAIRLSLKWERIYGTWDKISVHRRRALAAQWTTGPLAILLRLEERYGRSLVAQFGTPANDALRQAHAVISEQLKSRALPWHDNTAIACAWQKEVVRALASHNIYIV
jgi:hypothetical protein